MASTKALLCTVRTALLVQHNVVYNNRGPSIYIEDGNEVENVVEENVIICSN